MYYINNVDSEEMTMARETKAERLVREEAEHEARVEALKAEYPERLMAAMARAYENNYDVVPKNNEFRLVDRDERDNAFTVSYAFTEVNDATLNELDWTLTYKEEKVREERRKMEVRNAAWYKLTEEERQLLGLTK
jgi:outer membrane cobalamin receptor